MACDISHSLSVADQQPNGYPSDCLSVAPSLQGDAAALAVAERIARRVVRAPNGCLRWTGATSEGYGRIRFDGRVECVHRVAYWLARGRWPTPGMDLDHLCRQRDCCEPAHVEEVTRGENFRRGAGPSAVNARKSHCIHGHLFTPENTYRIKTHNRRICRTCTLARQRAAYAEKVRARKEAA